MLLILAVGLFLLIAFLWIVLNRRPPVGRQRLGSAGTLLNLMVGQFGKRDVRLIEYYCKAGPGRDRAHTSKTTVVIFPNATAALPDFMLVPRVGLKSHASVMNLMFERYPDLRIGEKPAHPFASHYWVGGKDGNALRHLFTPKVMDFFVENKNWNVEALNRYVAVYRIDKLVKVQDYAKRLDKALLLVNTLTRR